MNDILFVTIDSIRADRLQGPETSEIAPNLHSIAEQGLTCDHAYANGIPTYFAFKSLLGGIHALSCERGIGLPQEIRSLPEILSEAGYTTAGFNAANPWLTPEYGYDRGFDHFEDFLTDEGEDGMDLMALMRNVQSRLRDGSTLRNWLGYGGRLFCTYADINPIQSGETLTDAALEWLEETASDKPVFLWLHYMDPHYPWVPETNRADGNGENLRGYEVARLWHKVATSDYSPGETEGLAETAQELYDADVRYVDRHIGRLVSRFRELRDDEPHMIVTGDHGTELGDHGGFSHGPDTLYQEIIHVPLLISSPDVEAGQIQRPVGLVDVPSTIVDLVSGVSADFEGTSILSGEGNRLITEVIYDAKPASSENMDNASLFAVINPPWKLIYNENHDSTELYHLKDDPQESRDLSGQEVDVRESLLKAIEDHRCERSRWSKTHSELHTMRRFVRSSHL